MWRPQTLAFERSASKVCHSTVADVGLASGRIERTSSPRTVRARSVTDATLKDQVTWAGKPLTTRVEKVVTLDVEVMWLLTRRTCAAIWEQSRLTWVSFDFAFECVAACSPVVQQTALQRC